MAVHRSSIVRFIMGMVATLISTPRKFWAGGRIVQLINLTLDNGQIALQPGARALDQPIGANGLAVDQAIFKGGV